MAEKTTPTTRKSAERASAEGAAKTAAARSTAARKAAVTRGVHRTEAAADKVSVDRGALRADNQRLVEAVVSTGRSVIGLAGNYAERAADVQVGAVLTATDAVGGTIVDLRARLGSRQTAEVELRRLERRGEAARRRARLEAGRTRARIEGELRRLTASAGA